MAFGFKQAIAQVGTGTTSRFMQTSDFYSDSTLAGLLGISRATDQAFDDLEPPAKLIGVGRIIKIFVNATNGTGTSLKKRRFRLFVARSKLGGLFHATDPSQDPINGKIVKQPTGINNGTTQYADWTITDVDFKRDASFTM
jgi:hypothetical protein